MSKDEWLDPYTRAFESIAEIIAGLVGEDLERVRFLLTPPSRQEYGDLSFPAIRYAKRSNIGPEELANKVMDGLVERGIDYVSTEVLKGYVNFRFNIPRVMELVAVRRAGTDWSELLFVPKAREPAKLVVEHTSANPIHPLHMGHARNSSLGDSLSRLLSARGHTVNRRFYVDDVGKQVAVAALGVRILGVDVVSEARRRGVKPDALLGWIYAVTHTLIDVRVLKRKIAEGIESDRARSELDDLLATLASLKDEWGFSDLFEKLMAGIEGIEDPEALVAEMMKRYERGLEPEKTLIRRTAEAALEGIRETLERIDVFFDDWDWESFLVWSGRVERVIEEAKRSGYYTIYKGAEALDLPRFVREKIMPDPELRRRFRLPKGFEIPPLILRRSDGTTLYTTRDIAYSIYKFEVTGADRVYNVIGADQRLAQLQVRLALAALGYMREALNMIHYDYELVLLPGQKMSSRRGRIVTLDRVLDSLKAIAEEEVEKRNPSAPREWISEVAEKIAVGALRFRLVQTSAPKVIVFDYSKALDISENSGPYLQYTYARASSIMRKLGSYNPQTLDPNSCEAPKRRELAILALRYPLTAAKSADDLAPELLAAYLLKLADAFNSWYQEDSVIREPDAGARACKALLVDLVRSALSNGMRLLGIPVMEKM